jgi:Peptidoglycan-synthase activator LpoB
MSWIKSLSLFCRVAALGILSACGSAIGSGHNTALDAMDLQAMTSQMAASIMASPAVEAEIQAHGPLRVVCEPVENRMTGEILPTGQAQAYTAQVRALLSQHDPDSFMWIMNRDEFYALRQSELVNVPLGPSPDAVQPQYALAARFDSLTQEDSSHRSAYYLCVYRLTDLDQRRVLWSGQYQVKKNAVKGFLD